MPASASMKSVISAAMPGRDRGRATRLALVPRCETCRRSPPPKLDATATLLEGLGDGATCQIQGAECTEDRVAVGEEAQVEDGDRADGENE